MNQAPKFINVGDRQIAVLNDAGKAPGLFWLSGFNSTMRGEKAEAIAEFGRKEGLAVTRMDYSGHGESSGNFVEGTISDWLEEALAVFDQTIGEQVIVGSSMGGWITLLLALELKRHGETNRLKGLVLIAPAWDMTESLIWARMNDAQRAEMEEKGVFYRPSNYGDPYPISHALIEDGRNHLLPEGALHFGCPIHIIHGRQDVDVPFAHSEELMTRLLLDDVTFSVVRDGEHRLSRPQDIELLLRAISSMIAC